MRVVDVADNICLALSHGGAGTGAGADRHCARAISYGDGGARRGSGARQGLTLVHFQLNLSRILSLTPFTYTEYPTKRAHIEPRSGRV